MTNSSENAEDQSIPEVNTQAETAPSPTTPDRSWVEFDLGMRSQDPNVIQHKVVGPTD
ncbi:hypothetical protein [Mycobacterium colombiense]